MVWYIICAVIITIALCMGVYVKCNFGIYEDDTDDDE